MHGGRTSRLFLIPNRRAQGFSMVRYYRLAETLLVNHRKRVLRAPPFELKRIKNPWLLLLIEGLWRLPSLLSARHDTWVVFDQGKAPLGKLVNGDRGALVVHDLINFPEESASLAKRWFKACYSATVLAAVSRDALNIFVSGRTAEEYTGRFGACGSVIPLPVTRRESGSRKRSTVLNVGNGLWYKNRSAFFKLAESLPDSREVVYVGPPDAEAPQKAKHWANVSEEELCRLYASALVMVFPSIIEGFGWPIVEAQSFGTPVIVANRSPMRNIVGDGGFVVDVDEEGRIQDMEACLAYIGRLAADAEFFADESRKALANSRRYRVSRFHVRMNRAFSNYERRRRDEMACY